MITCLEFVATPAATHALSQPTESFVDTASVAAGVPIVGLRHPCGREIQCQAAPCHEQLLAGC
jgi:hypothetical protein